MTIDPTIPRISSMLLLDAEGKRIAVKYFTPEWCDSTCLASALDTQQTVCGFQLTSDGHRSTVPAQSAFEKSVFAKTSRTTAARGEGRLQYYHKDGFRLACMSPCVWSKSTPCASISKCP